MPEELKPNDMLPPAARNDNPVVQPDARGGLPPKDDNIKPVKGNAIEGTLGQKGFFKK